MKLPQHHLVYEVLRPGRQGKHTPGTRPPQTNGCLTSGDLSPEMDVITFHANTVRLLPRGCLLLHEQDRLILA